MDKYTNSTNKLFRLFPLLLILSVLLVNLSLYFTGKLGADMFNSDLLYLPALYKDVVEGGGLFANWILTPAPYYFPDMPLYFISRLLTGNFYYAIALVFTLHSLLLVYIIYKIFALFFDKPNSLTLSAIIFAFLHLYPTATSNFMFVGTIHYGEFLVGMYVLYLTLLVLNSQKIEFYSLFALLVLISLATASDASFKLHFVAPILAGTLILWAIKRVTWLQLLSILIVSFVALQIAELVHPSFPMDEKLVTGNNIQALNQLWSVASKDHTLGVLVGVFTLLSSFMLLLFKKRLTFFYGQYSTSSQLMFLSLFILLMGAGIVVVLALAPIPITTRYMIPFFEIPVLLVPIYLGFLGFFANQKITKFLLALVAIFMFILVLIQARERLHHAKFNFEYYPPITQCVDNFVGQTGARSGIATYWNAKPIYLTSKYPLTIAQMQYDLSADRIISPSTWVQKKYDFAMIVGGDMDKEKIIRLNGKPDKVYSCEKSEILYYKNKMRTE